MLGPGAHRMWVLGPPKVEQQVARGCIPDYEAATPPVSHLLELVSYNVSRDTTLPSCLEEASGWSLSLYLNLSYFRHFRGLG